MDWQNKFYSIVKETEENLSKAKEKLSGKATSSLNNTFHGLPLSGKERFALTDFFGTSYSKPIRRQRSPLHFEDPEPSVLNMSASSGIQVLHMQKQIDAQNKTIERLQNLVRNLDSERDFYKEEISHLRGEIGALTDRMSNQFTLAQSENHASGVRQEMMREIEKLKTMLQMQASNMTKSPQSPRMNAELWTVKENLTDSLEHVHHELSVMNTRIDRMETQVVRSSLDNKTRDLTEDRLSRNYSDSHFQRSPRLCTPLTRTEHDSSTLDVLQLRQSIASVTSKLDGLERRLDISTGQTSGVGDSRLYTALRSRCDNFRPLSSTFRSRTDLYMDNLTSDVSDMSDIEDDMEDLISGMPPLPRNLKQSSIYKSSARTKGKVEFDLSDLDLSDVDDADVDLDSLELDN